MMNMKMIVYDDLTILLWWNPIKTTVTNRCQKVSPLRMTSSQIYDTFLFHRVIKILTGGRILQISIAWCQIDREIHSFPTMYGNGGGIFGKNWRNKGFRQKVMPKTRLFWGHKSGSSHFRLAWGPLFQRWCQFRYVPQKIWVKSFQMSYGHVR